MRICCLGPRAPLPWIACCPVRFEATAGVLCSRRARASEQETRRAEEASWIGAARDGDADAFRRLVERYRDRAYETALRIVRSPEEAEEVAQDAFVRAWRALPGFREDARFSTWLYRIVTRRALDVASAARRRSERETPAEPSILEQRPARTPPSLPDTSLRRLNAVLGELDALPRAIVTLFYLRDRSVGEIAGILDLPDGTVKTHLHRSRAALRLAWRRHAVREGWGDGLPRV